MPKGDGACICFNFDVNIIISWDVGPRNIYQKLDSPKGRFESPEKRPWNQQNGFVMDPIISKKYPPPPPPKKKQDFGATNLVTKNV